MNGGFVAGVALIVGLLLARSRLLSWLFARWAAGDISDGRARILFGLIAFAPLIVGGLWIALAGQYPWNLLVLVIFIVASIPAAGLGNAMFDYLGRNTFKRGVSRDDVRADASGPTRQ